MEGHVAIKQEPVWCEQLFPAMATPGTPSLPNVLSKASTNMGQGIDQLAQSSYSAAINLAHLAATKQEPVADLEPAPVSYPWSAFKSHFEPNTSTDIKYEGQDLETATDVTSRVSPEDRECTVRVRQSAVADFDPDTPINIKCEAKDSAVSSEGRPRGRGSTTRMATLAGAKQSKHDTSREEVSVMEVSAKHNKPTGEKRFNCDICGRYFPLNSQLVSHMRTHTGVKPYACDMCKASFSQKSTLTKHMTTHTGVKPYTCDVCGGSFSRMSHLASHMTTHTGVKLYTCHICGESLSRISHLTSHMIRHTGVKPFACDVCGGSFSDKSTLTRHLRTHTGVKPYACDICGGSFSRKCTLASHMRTHTGVKPYACDICGGSFSHKSNLTKHLRTHTKAVSL